MKYFIDTHDHSKGSFPNKRLSEGEFVATYGGFERACESEGGLALGAHVNLPEGKAFCFTAGPDVEAIRRAHEAIRLPYDSITEVKRVTGVDLR
jgi:Nickel responsive protein SCO4226-like